MTTTTLLHYGLLAGVLALPIGLLVLTLLQICLLLRIKGEHFNFISIMRIDADRLTPLERRLRRLGAGLLAGGLLLVVLTVTAFFFGW